MDIEVYETFTYGKLNSVLKLKKFLQIHTIWCAQLHKKTQYIVLDKYGIIVYEIPYLV